MSHSDGEERLAFQLKAVKIEFEREYVFSAERDFRFDFVIRPFKLAVEVDGGAYTGGHRRGEKFDDECRKTNLAVIDHWRVLHFSPAMVKSGEALVVIEKAVESFTDL